MTAALTSTEVLDSIERSFSAKGGWICIREISLVSNLGRRADAIALQTYESRGVHLHGFEVKVSRADWRRELADAAKADELVAVCRYFSIVAAAGIVDVADLPEGWGLFEVRGLDRRLFRVRAAAERPETRVLSLDSLARILRRSIDGIRAPGNEARQAERDAAYKAGLKAGQAQGGDAWDRTRYEDLVKVVRAFEAASGIDLNDWLNERRADRLGKAARMVLEAPGTVARIAEELARYGTTLQELAAADTGHRIDAMLAEAGR